MMSLLERKKCTTPEAFATYVRSLGKIFFWETGGFWVLTHYDDAKEALRNPALSCDRSSFFISRMPDIDLNLIPDFFSVVKKMMIMSDDKTHEARRGVAQQAFSKEVIAEYGRVAKATAAKLLAEHAGKSSFDFMEIARILPSHVLADLFAIPETDRKDFYGWSIHMTRFFGGASKYQNEDGIAVNACAKALTHYIGTLIEERKKNHGSDFLSLLLESNRFFQVSDPELVAQSLMMLIAGQVTTTDQIANNLYTLLEKRERFEALQKNPSLLPTALEECNRWDPGVTFLFRVAKEKTEIGGIPIEAGDVVFMSNHALNRDPLVFENPEAFKLDRFPNPHMAYGYGPHYCMGAPLARLQMIGLFEEVLRQYPEIRLDLDRPAIRDHYSLAFSGFQSLTVN